MLFLHGLLFSNEHGKARRDTDAGLFCTNLTNLTNDTNVVMYGTHGKQRRDLLLHGLLFSNEHGGTVLGCEGDNDGRLNRMVSPSFPWRDGGRG